MNQRKKMATKSPHPGVRFLSLLVRAIGGDGFDARPQTLGLCPVGQVSMYGRLNLYVGDCLYIYMYIYIEVTTIGL